MVQAAESFPASSANLSSANRGGTAQGSRALTAIFLAISFLASLRFLSVRNTYDDENSTLAYVNSFVGQIVQMANTRDVHPLGMYLLAHFAYQAIPSPRWIATPGDRTVRWSSATTLC
jgi:hypothetical protein